MQYRLIINNGSKHTGKAIANTTDQLRKEVEYCKEMGYTIVEVQTREGKTENAGWMDWKTT